jgi:hypothetical protein
MTQALILLVKIAVGVLILAIGMGATVADLAYVWRRPGLLLLRSLFAMYVLVPRRDIRRSQGHGGIPMRTVPTTHDGRHGTRRGQVGLPRGLAVLAMAVVLLDGAVWAAEEEINKGQDPTKPLTRIDVCYQYQNLPPADHDNAHIFTPRADKPFVLAPGWNLATRLDLPLFLTDAVSPDNPGERIWSESEICSCTNPAMTFVTSVHH